MPFVAKYSAIFPNLVSVRLTFVLVFAVREGSDDGILNSDVSSWLFCGCGLFVVSQMINIIKCEMERNM